jgi:hypothetical protein
MRLGPSNWEMFGERVRTNATPIHRARSAHTRSRRKKKRLGRISLSLIDFRWAPE